MKSPKKKRRTPPQRSTATSVPASIPPEPFTAVAKLPARLWLLAAMTALLVARPLIPSAAVAWLGDGQPFCMLWLLLAVSTALAAIKGGGLPQRFGAVELLLVVFTVLHSLAAWRGAEINPRPAINMLWEGVAMAASFLLVRQLVASRQEARALVAVMIALAVVMSTFGLHQVFIGLPADRAEYALDPDGMLRRAGQWYAPASPERMAFENRLQSTEPLATFALTNSLAGFLVGWLIVGLGLLRSRMQKQPRFGLLASLAMVALCLVLTKSRSALVAGAMGILAISLQRGVLRRRWKLAIGMAAAGLFCIAAAATLGKLDEKVITEAGKSLGYRMQYWQSTSAMIGDRPLLGVGPGNFQDYYTRYKLPTASEEIRDPHHWMFEIAATAGLPALVAFCAFLGLVLWKAVRGAQVPRVEQASPDRNQPSPNGFLFAGAASGFLVALVIGPLAGLPLGFEKLAGGLLVGGLVLYVLRPWIAGGALPPAVLALGSAVLLVNLLAAGGIMYPGIAGSLWLMLGLAVNLVEPRRAIAGKYVPGAAFAICSLLALGQYWTGYAPVLRAQGLLMEAQNGDATTRESTILAAAEADPRASEPWQDLAALRLQVLQNRPGSRALGQFRDACEEFLARKQHSSSAHRLVGNWWWQVYEQTESRKGAAEAVRRFARAVELYPNHATLRAELALALASMGNQPAARGEADKALNLDAATPHTDKKLTDKNRQKMAEIAGSQPDGSR